MEYRVINWRYMSLSNSIHYSETIWITLKQRDAVLSTLRMLSQL